MKTARRIRDLFGVLLVVLTAFLYFHEVHHPVSGDEAAVGVGAGVVQRG